MSRTVAPETERENQIYDRAFMHGVAVARYAVQTNFDRPITEILLAIGATERDWLEKFKEES